MKLVKRKFEIIGQSQHIMVKISEKDFVRGVLRSENDSGIYLENEKGLRSYIEYNKTS